MTEGRNTGFEKILNALEVNGSPKPEFETDDEHSYFITRLFVHEAFLQEEPKKSQKRAKKEPKKSSKRAERKQAISELLNKKSYNDTNAAYAGIDANKKTDQTDMKELQEEGVLVREGSNRYGRWGVKM